MLDGDIDSVQDYDDSKRNSEKDHTKIIQVSHTQCIFQANEDYIQASCRRLRTLLYILSHPETNFIKYANYDMVVVKGSVCMVLRQLLHKTRTLWKTFFEHLKSWIKRPRVKTIIFRQRATVATSLAQLFRSIKIYDKTFITCSSRVMVRTEWLNL